MTTADVSDEVKLGWGNISQNWKDVFLPQSGTQVPDVFDLAQRGGVFQQGVDYFASLEWQNPIKEAGVRLSEKMVRGLVLSVIKVSREMMGRRVFLRKVATALPALLDGSMKLKLGQIEAQNHFVTGSCLVAIAAGIKTAAFPEMLGYKQRQVILLDPQGAFRREAPAWLAID